ncbi:hypothetical protein MHU86_16471 [Fragilaria crotonensis]|nr:hypothetical protein MHU86_16471 [Fragilaria crotonensis]
MATRSKRVVYLVAVMALLGPGECFIAAPGPSNKRPLQCQEDHKRKQCQQRHMTAANDDDDDTPTSSSSTPSATTNSNIYKPRNLGDICREFIRHLAELSLEDYKWRSGVFKAMTADRLLEASLARMRGDPSPGYYRPMDAPQQFVGPLGRAEDSAVSWLKGVIEEEGRRAQLIFDQNGVLVRPMEVDGGHGGPLADIESTVVQFFNAIRDSERLRKSMGILRPKDMDEAQRGPLGDAEHRLYKALKDLTNAETLRYEQSQQRGSSVRPMDVPGPLGEVEAAVFEIFKAEQRRAKEKELSQMKRPLRPKDAALPGPLGDAEQEAIRAFQRLSEEERERLRGILKTLEDNRPMEINRDSILGAMEAVIVGILRAPRMLTSVWDRVTELLQSEPLPSLETAKKRLQPPSVTTTTLRMPDDIDDELGAFE